jgi:hypothetical protein
MKMKTIKLTLLKLLLTIVVACAIGFTVGSVGLCRLLNVGCPVPYAMSTQNFVRRDTAHMWAMNFKHKWDTLTNKPKGNVPIKYFTIRSQDVLCAMGIDTAWQYETAYRYVRINVGYNMATQELKAYIQPVKDVDLSNPTNPFAGTGLFFNKKGQIVDSLGNLLDKNGRPHKIKMVGKTVPDTAVYVADLNTPCPSTCGN